MVTNITSLGGKGTSDWLLQRVSALVLLAWIFCVGGSVLFTDGLTYDAWRGLFDTTAMRVFSLAALLALCAHALDRHVDHLYRLPDDGSAGKSAAVVRLLFQLACLLVLFTYFVWGIQILWSV